MTPRESGLKQRIEKLEKIAEEIKDYKQRGTAFQCIGAFKAELDKTIAEIKKRTDENDWETINIVLKLLDSKEGKK